MSSIAIRGPAVTAARHPLLVDLGSALMGLAALVMAALDVSDRAAYQSIELTEVGMVADHWLWMWLYLAVGLWVLTGVSVRAARPHAALHAATGIWVTWGGANLVVGLTASHPVSLVGPILALVAGIGCGLLADAEAQRGGRRVPL